MQEEEEDPSEWGRRLWGLWREEMAFRSLEENFADRSSNSTFRTYIGVKRMGRMGWNRLSLCCSNPWFESAWEIAVLTTAGRDLERVEKSFDQNFGLPFLPVSSSFFKDEKKRLCIRFITRMYVLKIRSLRNMKSACTYRSCCLLLWGSRPRRRRDNLSPFLSASPGKSRAAATGKGKPLRHTHCTRIYVAPTGSQCIPLFANSPKMSPSSINPDTGGGSVQWSTLHRFFVLLLLNSTNPLSLAPISFPWDLFYGASLE